MKYELKCSKCGGIKSYHTSRKSTVIYICGDCRFGTNRRKPSPSIFRQIEYKGPRNIPKGYPIQCGTCCVEFNSTGDEFCPDCIKPSKPSWHGAYWHG